MINFSINKAYFLQALNTTKRAISSKNAIPILSTIKIDVTTEGITLIGSNGQISIEHFISVKEEFILEIGDIVVLISALLFGIHIIVIDYSAARVNSMFLSIVQLVVVSILSLVFAIFTEKIILADILSVIWPLLAVGVLSSGVGYTLQIVGQKNVPPHTASLILSLESIVAVIGGVLILNEHVGIREGLGMLIVFAGIIISQVPDKKQIEK